jgi:hypothetical protein
LSGPPIRKYNVEAKYGLERRSIKDRLTQEAFKNNNRLILFLARKPKTKLRRVRKWP